MDSWVLAEKLKEEINGQKIRAAVFQSFNFDPDFFENYLLPLFLSDIPFGDNRIQNMILWRKFQNELPPITVYCDFHAKSQKSVNLNYTVKPIDLPRKNGLKPCFHPKHTYVLLEDWTLLVFVGSNNLTESGWCSNLEGVNFFRLKNKEYFPENFKNQLKDFNRSISKIKKGEKNQFSEAEEVIDSFFRQQGYTENINVELFKSDESVLKDDYLFSNFISKIREEKNNGHPFEKVEVISPYFPNGVNLFNKLIELSGTNNIEFAIPFESTDSISLDKELFDKVVDLGIKWKAIKDMKNVKGYRFNHSKIYQFTGDEFVFIIVGSINFTNMAWKGIRNGGNYESAILYQISKDKKIDLLEDCNFDNLQFIGSREDETSSDNRHDVYDLEFIIDWSAKTLEVVNEFPETQKGRIIFGNLSVKLFGNSRVIDLDEDYLEFLTNESLIKVSPNGLDAFYYYYPIHKNIESKPLPEELHLKDAELLQLWMELEESDNKEVILRIIDRFIDRITDESGDIIKEQVSITHSTLNQMSTHLNGLIKLHRKIFYGKDGLITSKNSKSSEIARKRAEYYLFADNVDTLIGYRKLLKKMYAEGKLNTGFYWLLLSILIKYFYEFVNKINHDLDKELINSRYKEINLELNEIEKKLNNKSVSKKHLIWISKMLEYDIAGE